MSERVIVSGLPERLPWIEGADYDILPGAPKYGDLIRVRDNSGETFSVYTEPGTGGLVPKPNNPGNPYFGKRALETKDFYALVGQILNAARFKRLITDGAFLWVGKVLDHVDHVDPDDQSGQFLQITTYLQATNAEDGQKLITAQEVAAIMAAWA